MSTNCPVCGSTDTYEYYKVENMPIFFHPIDKSLLSQAGTHTFLARFCKNCSFGFNASPLSSKTLSEIYKSYQSVSPIIGIGKEKSKELVEYIVKHCTFEDSIIEIGCYDGYLLHCLKERGYKRLLGVEPSEAANVARSKGIKVIKDFFREDIEINSPVDCFVMSHVYEHLPDPVKSLQVLKSFLSEKGKIIIEVPYLEGYHHEHLFFFSLLSLKKLSEMVKLKVVDAEISNYFEQAPVIRVVMADYNNQFLDDTCVVEDIIEKHDEIEKICLERFKIYNLKLQELKNILSTNKELYWWGAGTSSIIYLNSLKDYIHQANVDVTVLDSDPNRWGKYIPGIGLEVKSYQEFFDKELPCLVITSQFYREIIETLKINKICADRVEIFY